MYKLKEALHSNSLNFCIILLGLTLRLLVATMGHNYDFDSFVIVANIVENGQNVYATTHRYNYGPVWFELLWLLFRLSLKNELVFRYTVATFLSLIDFYIFIVLTKKCNKVVAYLFFLNPISIIITGYHNQFDNLALVLGMLAVNVMGNNFENHIDKKKIFGLFILGMSMVTKHILFLFPVWIAVKQKGGWQKIITVSIPMLIFILSFAPYWSDGRQGIIQNIFLYRSFDNPYFYSYFAPTILKVLFSSRTVWILLLIIFALVFRKFNSFDSLLFYTCILVIVSPAIANQYLVIALPFIVANRNLFTVFYVLLGALFLLIDPNGLHIWNTLPTLAGSYAFLFYPLLIFLLFLGFLRSRWPSQISSLKNKIYTEIKIQLGYES